jgi:hypothetical protein
MLARLIRSALLALTLAACSITSPADASRKGGFGFGFPHKTQTIVPQTPPPPVSAYDTRFGVTDPATGWIDFPLRAGARRVWVNSSGGNDANSCLSAALACASLDAASVVYQGAGYTAGDQLMLAGTGNRTYTDTGALHSVVNKSGFSLTYPAAILSYDPADPTNSAKYGKLLGADRPRINEPGVSGLDATQTPAFTVATPTINYIAIQGLEFVASGAAAGGSGAAMGVSGSGAHTGIAYQNVVFNRVGFVFDIDETANQANWGSTFLVSKAAGGGTNNGINGNASWLYASGIDGLWIQGSTSVHPGWSLNRTRYDTDQSLGTPAGLGHGIYYSATNKNGRFNWIVALDPPQDGFSLRGAAASSGLVSIDAAMPMSMGGFSNPTFTDEAPSGVVATVTDFTFMGGTNVNPTLPEGYGPGADNLLLGSFFKNGAMFDNPIYGGVNNYAWTNQESHSGTSDSLLPQIDEHVVVDGVRWYNYSPIMEAPAGTHPERVFVTFQNCKGDTITPQNANTVVAGSCSTWSGAPGSYQTQDQIISAVLTQMGVTPGANAKIRKAQLANWLFEYPDLAGDIAKAIDTLGLASLGLTPQTHAAFTMSNVSSRTAPRLFYSVTAPTLSSPTGTATGTTTATVGATTDTGNGTLLAVVSTSNTVPTAAQIEAHKEASGSAAPAFVYQAITATGAQTINVTGLASGTPYYAHLLQVSGGVQFESNIVTSASFTPTASFATLNPADMSGLTLSNGNLTAQPTSNVAGPFGVRATRGATTGKHYWEVHVDTYADSWSASTADSTASLTASYWWQTANAHAQGWAPGVYRYNTTTASYGMTGGTVRMALDADTKTLWVGDSTGWFNGDPVAGTGGTVLSGLTGAIYPAWQGAFTDKVTFNFGASAYTFTPPTGFGNMFLFFVALPGRRRRRRPANDNAALVRAA